MRYGFTGGDEDAVAFPEPGTRVEEAEAFAAPESEATRLVVRNVIAKATRKLRSRGAFIP